MKPIPIDELIELYYEKNMSAEDIAKITGGSPQTVRNRIYSYYKNTNIKKPEKPRTGKKQKSRNTKQRISLEELAKEYESGTSAAELGKRYEVSTGTVYEWLKDYYNKSGIKRQTQIERSGHDIKDYVSPEEILNLRKTKSVNEIAEMYNRKPITIYKIIQRYREKNGIIDNQMLDDQLMDILMNGSTIASWETKEPNELIRKRMNERLLKLKFVVEHADFVDDEFVADKNFMEIIKILENPQIMFPGMKYKQDIMEYLNEDGICEKGNIDNMKKDPFIFNQNPDLATYILSSFNLSYGEYDLKEWERMKNAFRNKIEMYFSRIHVLEKNQDERISGKQFELDEK